MKKTVPNGFTLIELLVVIAVIAIVGTFAIANFRSFGEDKELENAALDIQSQVRTAQANASSGLKCENTTALQWRNDFYRQSDGYKIRLSCINDGTFTPKSPRYLVLPANIIIENIVVDGSSNSLPNLFTENPWGGSYATTVFNTPFAEISFRCNINYPTSGCSGGVPDGKVTIQLKNTKTNSTKQVIIDKGGRIYVQ